MFLLNKNVEMKIRKKRPENRLEKKLKKPTDKTMTYGRKSYRRQKKAGKSGATRT